MNVSNFFLFAVLLILTGCGGGVGGSTTDPDPTDNVDPPPVNSSDTSAPTAEILFPLPISRTDASKLVIRGIASDASAVKAIRVNGVSAQINTTTVNASNASKSVPNRTPMANGGASVTVAATADLVEWEVELTVPEYSTLEINVETEDEFGNINSAADTAFIITQKVPTNFTIDKLNHRLIGQAEYNKLVIFDLLTQNISTLEMNDIDAFEDFVYVESIDGLIYTELSGSLLQLYSVDLHTGFANILINHDLEFDTSVWSFAQITNIDYAQSGDELYLLMSYFSATGSGSKNVVLKYDLDSNTITNVVDEKTTTNKKIATPDLAYTDDGLLIFNRGFGGGDDGLSVLAFDGSDSTALSTGPRLSSLRLDVDLVAGKAYQSGFAGVAEIDLSTGIVTPLSIEDAETELNISQIGSTGIDLANKQLLIADSDLDILISVDLQTGERDVFISNGVGTGRLMVAPRELVVDSNNNRAYVLDDGGNGPENILAIDLNTGDRTSIADINHQYNVSVDDIILDSQAQQLYVFINNEILKVDIQLQTVDVVSSNSVGTGPDIESISGGVLDAANHRLIVTDSGMNSVLAIDLTSGERSVISTSVGGGVGGGVDISGPTDIAVDLSSNTAYVISQSEGALYSIDLDTGDRALLLDSCLNDFGMEMIPSDSGRIQNVVLDSIQQQLLVTGEYVFRYDLVSGECVASSIRGVFDLAVSDKGQVFATDFNKLMQLDMESSSQVIVSK
jgi:hypothetical protein